MAEYVVHDHYDAPSSTSGANYLLGAVLMAVIVLALLFYGLPLIRSAMTPQVGIPSHVDVNLNQK